MFDSVIGEYVEYVDDVGLGLIEGQCKGFWIDVGYWNVGVQLIN